MESLPYIAEKIEFLKNFHHPVFFKLEKTMKNDHTVEIYILHF